MAGWPPPGTNTASTFGNPLVGTSAVAPPSGGMVPGGDPNGGQQQQQQWGAPAAGMSGWASASPGGQAPVAGGQETYGTIPTAASAASWEQGAAQPPPQFQDYGGAAAGTAAQAVQGMSQLSLSQEQQVPLGDGYHQHGEHVHVPHTHSFPSQPEGSPAAAAPQTFAPPQQQAFASSADGTSTPGARGPPEEALAISVTAEEAAQLMALQHVTVPQTPTAHMSEDQIRAENDLLRQQIAQFQRLQDVQKSRIRVHLRAEFGRTTELQRQIEVLQNDAANLLKERTLLGGKGGSGSSKNIQQSIS